MKIEQNKKDAARKASKLVLLGDDNNC